MICSDGIIDGCWEKHIHKALSQNMDSTSAAAEVLMNRAIENAGSDDTTLIVLDIQ
jgi:protein phosphatase